VIALIFLKKQNAEVQPDPAGGVRLFSMRDLAGFAVAFVALTALVSLSPTVDLILFHGFYWGITGMGCILLAAVLAMIARRL